MKPGRELDALIAEKVMGETVTWGGDPGGTIIPWVGEPDGIQGECPPYSTDIAAAWAVVEKKSGCNLIWHGDLQEWHCQFFGDPTFGEIGKAPIAPLAICLAALKAMSTTTNSVSS